MSSPPFRAMSETLRLVRNQFVNESPFTGSVQGSDGYSQWHLELAFPPMNAAKARHYLAWADSLRGRLNTFTYSPHGSGLSIGARNLASTGFAYTNTVAVGGWTGGATSGVATGTLFSISNRLFRVISASANASGSGVITITFEPRLRVTINAGTSVVFDKPQGEFRLSDESQIGVTKYVDQHLVDPIVAVEAL